MLDFKPIRPAFTELVPVPAEYVGGETYFGESSASETDTLESLIHHTVDAKEFDRLKRKDARSVKLNEVLTATAIKGFRTGIVNFLVGACIQRITGQQAGKKLKKLRYSFLVHSEAGKDAHEWQEMLTKAIVSKLREASETSTAEFTCLIGEAYKDLSRSLKLAGQPIHTFDEVVLEHEGEYRIYRYQFRRTDVPTTYTFRLALPARGSGDYPFSFGASNAVTVHVRP